MKTLRILTLLLINIIVLCSATYAEVNLRYFTADKRGNDHLLTWESLSERNNQYYTIERSSTAQDFQEIGIVDGSANSNQIIEYSFNDDSPVAGDNYYRLRMIDDQNVITYSDVVMVKGITPPPITTLINFPGTILTGGSFSLKIARIANPELTFQVFGINGQLVFEQTSIVAYPQTITLDIPELQTGMYLLQVDDNKTLTTKRIVVTR